MRLEPVLERIACAMPYTKETIAANIAALRQSAGMTQAEFAQRLGVTGASVSAYENGVRSPSFDVLIKISNILGISTDELLGRAKKTEQTMDVSGLSEEQVASLRQMAAFYRKYNRMVNTLSEDPGKKGALNSLLKE